MDHRPETGRLYPEELQGWHGKVEIRRNRELEYETRPFIRPVSLAQSDWRCVSDIPGNLLAISSRPFLDYMGDLICQGTPDLKHTLRYVDDIVTLKLVVHLGAKFLRLSLDQTPHSN